MTNQFKKVGVGLRHTHFPEILEGLKGKEEFPVSFFEGISENFINTRGRPFKVLMQVREEYDISLHGVSLNIASHESVNLEYLKKLKELYRIVEPSLTSDHLCWTGLKATNIHNLLPFPYTTENLNFLAEKVKVIQDVLERPMAFENLSAYFSFKDSEMREEEFLVELAAKTDCKILLDLNNVYVNSQNQKFDPYDFIETIPLECVSEIHLAGHTDKGNFLFDTHSEPVKDEVWELYKHVIHQRDIPTLIEWDENIPTLNRVFEESSKAVALINSLEKVSV